MEDILKDLGINLVRVAMAPQIVEHIVAVGMVAILIFAVNVMVKGLKNVIGVMAQDIKDKSDTPLIIKLNPIIHIINLLLSNTQISLGDL